jgi:dolichyl-diphosphooligosaccharide--protein glycosyltransferase
MAAPEHVRPKRAALALIAALCAALALVTRELLDVRITRLSGGDPSAGWYSNDPDGLYHARRVERAWEESAWPASRDPWLNFPHGSAVPWPPYYDALLASALAPAIGAGPQRRQAIERAVCSAPWLLSALTAALLAYLGAFVAGPSGGLAAGVTYASLGASIYYSAPGVGDHHAWVALLETCLFALATWAFARARTLRRAALLGALAGGVTGLLLGSWVGALVYLGLVQVAVGLLLFVRRERRDLCAFAVAMHAVALVVLLPAVLHSPWKDEQPWMVVNLSWFHVAYLAVGGLAFLPPLPLRANARAAVLWPWILVALAAGAALAVAASPDPLSRSLREGLAWASRHNDFMAYIQESQPLFAAGWRWVLRDLGFAALLAPLLWLLVAWRALRQRDEVALLWTVLALGTGIQVLAQRRFGDAFGPALAMLLALGAARLPRRLPVLAHCALLGLAAALLQAPTLADALQRLRLREPYVRGPQSEAWRGQRELAEWIGAQTLERTWSVLAPWDRGHFIEWAARAPSVGTNFGSYVGRDSYLDPGRFLLEEAPEEAELLLIERRARYVMLPLDWIDSLEVLIRVLRPGLRSLYLSGAQPAQVTPRFARSMGARLMYHGLVDASRGAPPEAQLDFLRLVHVSPRAWPLPLSIALEPGQEQGRVQLPCGWIWERVAGARVSARADPGTRLELELEVEYPRLARALVWRGAALAGADGLARLRVPYSSERNGDGRAKGRARFRLGGHTGEIEIPEAAVLEGLALSAR